MTNQPTMISFGKDSPLSNINFVFFFCTCPNGQVTSELVRKCRAAKKCLGNFRMFAAVNVDSMFWWLHDVYMLYLFLKVVYFMMCYDACKFKHCCRWIWIDPLDYFLFLWGLKHVKNTIKDIKCSLQFLQGIIQDFNGAYMYTVLIIWDYDNNTRRTCAESFILFGLSQTDIIITGFSWKGGKIECLYIFCSDIFWFYT